MSAEHCKADLMEVKERVVPAALRSRLLRYFSFWVQVHSSCVCLFVCVRFGWLIR